MNEPNLDELREELANAAGEVSTKRALVKRAEAVRDELITTAVAWGIKPAEVARVAGVSKTWVSKVAKRDEPQKPRSQAGKNVSDHSCVTVSDTVPELPATVDVSGRVTVRRRSRLGRSTVFVPAWRDGRPVSLADVLGDATAHDAERVMLTGPAPIDARSGATIAEQCRAWCLSDPGDGWRVADSGHYLRDPELPILRFVHELGGRVTILRAAAWWGETSAHNDTCGLAWRQLEAVLDRVKAFRGAGLADTPGTTGRALWMRTIPEAGGFDVQSDELRELIQATSGQGRVQLMPAAADRCKRFTIYDGRLMYAGLTWGMPVGKPARWTGRELDGLDARSMERALRGRGRWRVTVTVPETWAHVGLLMAPAAGGGWCYPDTPGATFETWADGSELWLAMRYGWNPTFHEGVTWAEGKPLNTWRDALVECWHTANRHAAESEAARLVARAIRSMILHTIGAFAARSHPTTGSTSIDTPELVPDNVAPGSVHTVGDRLVYELPGRAGEWSADAAHPEWSATVWARARTRLLDAPTGGQRTAGALWLPDRSWVVGFATDALYLADDPEWPEDGEVGRFRRKGVSVTDAPWPASYGELHRLRDMAEAVEA